MFHVEMFQLTVHNMTFLKQKVIKYIQKEGKQQKVIAKEAGCCIQVYSFKVEWKENMW